MGYLRSAPQREDKKGKNLVRFYLMQAGLDPYAEVTKVTPEILKKIKKIMEKEILTVQRGIAYGGTKTYPTLQTPAPTETDPNHAEWNPEAWIRYP